MAAPDGTGLGLIEFFDYLADKGLMNKATAAGRRSAAQKVLEIDDGWQSCDLRDLDLDEQFNRFSNLRKQDYKPQSLSVYGSRFKSAVGEYLRYLDDPSGFRASGAVESRSKSRKPPGQEGEPVGERSGASGGAVAYTEVAVVRGERDEPKERERLITYPFPIRAGMVAYLQIPVDLRQDEAERLAQFIQTLAMPAEAEV